LHTLQRVIVLKNPFKISCCSYGVDDMARHHPCTLTQSTQLRMRANNQSLYTCSQTRAHSAACVYALMHACRPEHLIMIVHS